MMMLQEEQLWLHVDAAYAGSAFVCPEFRKWMKVTYFGQNLFELISFVDIYFGHNFGSAHV